MIKVENRYDFSVEELTEILENTPIKVDFDTNAAVAEYIIQALNANAIIKRALGMETSFYHKDAPYHILINRNSDGKRMFECDARTIAFYACDPVQGRPHKGIVSEKKPMPTDIANISELLGNVNGWGIFQ